MQGSHGRAMGAREPLLARSAALHCGPRQPSCVGDPKLLPDLSQKSGWTSRVPQLLYMVVAKELADEIALRLQQHGVSRRGRQPPTSVEPAVHPEDAFAVNEWPKRFMAGRGAVP